jgi:hypothetical protein
MSDVQKLVIVDQIEELVEELYLIYVNDFITVGRFADYYDISEEWATELIHAGRSINHRRTK